MKFDAIIVGGGAAGLFCALTAGQRGKRVAVLEHNDTVGQKIAISGGGRCNFTNIHASADNYISANPDFCRSALTRFSPEDFLALVEKHGIAYREKKLGQQFCNGSSCEIIKMLLAECAEAGVEIKCGCKVQSIRRPGTFELATTIGGFSCDALVVATGGLSFARLGATDFGHRIARQFGLHVTPMRPGLVPLTFGKEDLSAFKGVSGTSIPVRTKLGGTSFLEALLVTHRGLSGPAILQISSYWKPDEPVFFDLLPDASLPASSPKTSLPTLLAEHWPRRFADAWCSRISQSKPPNKSSPAELLALDSLVHNWPVTFAGTEGYPKAEVTIGGVDTGELSSKTMEARSVRGLYFIGEVVDVTGWLGGYNFQWAWASGHAAGIAI